MKATCTGYFGPRHPSSIFRLSARFHVLHHKPSNIYQDWETSRQKLQLMAGTRRQSQARDTSNTHQRQRSASQVASIVPETVPETAIVAANRGETADSADEGSPHPERLQILEASSNRSVAAFCKNCHSNIGEFYNSWHKVTSSYYSPALLGSYRSLLRRADQKKEASDSTELAGW